MPKSRPQRISHHSLLFWLFPLVLILAIVGTAIYFQPQVKNLVDHVLVFAPILFMGY